MMFRADKLTFGVSKLRSAGDVSTTHKLSPKNSRLHRAKSEAVASRLLFFLPTPPETDFGVIHWEFDRFEWISAVWCSTKPNLLYASTPLTHWVRRLQPESSEKISSLIPDFPLKTLLFIDLLPSVTDD
ncbi:hypothetical protein KOR42_08780 [Thalassoglobus neptunius]|uniref:Uncharacterized protein n=1 Tax=Thalassoglobus neptunius TaxID=1938619 RepID=A0A5C5X349_9PLAN|nr:hypothetical protein KOR42_08780 [Thalassoglobus neptunius]